MSTNPGWTSPGWTSREWSGHGKPFPHPPNRDWIVLPPRSPGWTGLPLLSRDWSVRDPSCRMWSGVFQGRREA